MSNGVDPHHVTYSALRAQYPNLPHQLACSSRVKATEAVKSALTWQNTRKQAYPCIVAKAQQRARLVPAFKPVRTPRSIACPSRPVQRSYWVRIAEARASLTTVAGRIEMPCTASQHAACPPRRTGATARGAGSSTSCTS